MSYKVTIEAKDLNELKEKIAGLAMSFGMGEAPEVKAAPVETEPKEKKTRAPRKSTVQEAAETISEREETVSTQYTQEDASSFIKKLNEKKGITAAREVLNSVGANRMSEVKPEKYAELVSACEKRLA